MRQYCLDGGLKATPEEYTTSLVIYVVDMFLLPLFLEGYRKNGRV